MGLCFGVMQVGLGSRLRGNDDGWRVGFGWASFTKGVWLLGVVFMTSAPCQSRLNGVGLSFGDGLVGLVVLGWFGKGMAIPLLYFWC